MKSRELTAVVLKSVGFFIGASLLAYVFPTIFVSQRFLEFVDQASGLMLGMIGLFLLIALAKLFIAYVVWHLGDAIAKDIVAHPTDDAPISITANQFEALLYRIIGLYFVVAYLYTILDWIVVYIENYEYEGYGLDLVFLLRLGNPAFVVAFGSYLMRRPEKFVSFVRRLAGTQKPQDVF